MCCASLVTAVTPRRLRNADAAAHAGRHRPAGARRSSPRPRPRTRPGSPADQRIRRWVSPCRTASRASTSALRSALPVEDGAAEGTPDTAVATGLLTLDPHRLASPTNRVGARVTAELTAGARPTSTSAVWAPTAAGPSGSPPTTASPCCPSPSSTSRPASSSPATRARWPRASRCTRWPPFRSAQGARAEGNPLRFRIFATREGLVGGTTANGHVITPARPLRRAAVPPALSPNGNERLLRPHLRPQRPLRVRAGVGRRPVEHQGRLLERRTASSGATSSKAPRRPRSPSRAATTAARTGSAARWPTRRASTSPTAPSGTTSA